MAGQSLFHMGAGDLKHKVLDVVEEEGAARASYALKLLQSKGELTSSPQLTRLARQEGQRRLSKRAESQ